MKGISLLFFLVGCSNLPRTMDRTIGGMLGTRQQSFRQCYVESDSYKGRHDKALGHVDVNFIVTKDGKVEDEKIVKTEFKDANLSACILHQLRGIEFEPQGTEISVNQTINFLPAET